MAVDRSCAYCGASGCRLEREHVIPACLYPGSKATSPVQRMTVLACSRCNRGWSDDEAHFRNVLLVAGEPNASVQELWTTKASRSFSEVDGARRLRDLFEQMVPVSTPAGERWKVFPGRDERVMRVIRKIVRGLSHFHGIESAVSEERVWADVLKYRIPDELLESVTFWHRELDILQYWYEVRDDATVESLWFLNFFERRPFVAAVAPALRQE